MAKKWNSLIPLKVYRMMRAGMSDTDLCRELKVSTVMFYKWKTMYPELKDAVDTARKETDEGRNFPSWVYTRLSPRLKGLWDKIREFQKEDNAVVMIEKVLMDQGKRVRQQLFLHALCDSLFSPSRAMAAVNVTKRELDDWLENDPEFEELVREVQWHKKNWVDEMLMNLVEQQNPQAVIFASKTLNADRGYANLGTVQHEHSGEVLHGVLDLALVMPMLSQQSKDELLKAIRTVECENSKSLRGPEDPVLREIAGVGTDARN